MRVRRRAPRGDGGGGAAKDVPDPSASWTELWEGELATSLGAPSSPAAAAAAAASAEGAVAAEGAAVPCSGAVGTERAALAGEGTVVDADAATEAASSAVLERRVPGSRLVERRTNASRRPRSSLPDRPNRRAGRVRARARSLGAAVAAASAHGVAVSAAGAAVDDAKEKGILRVGTATSSMGLANRAGVRAPAATAAAAADTGCGTAAVVDDTGSSDGGSDTMADGDGGAVTANDSSVGQAVSVEAASASMAGNDDDDPEPVVVGVTWDDLAVSTSATDTVPSDDAFAPVDRPVDDFLADLPAD